VDGNLFVLTFEMIRSKFLPKNEVSMTIQATKYPGLPAVFSSGTHKANALKFNSINTSALIGGFVLYQSHTGNYCIQFHVMTHLIPNFLDYLKSQKIYLTSDRLITTYNSSSFKDLSILIKVILQNNSFTNKADVHLLESISLQNLLV
jgi:hypothetical protein